MGARALSAVSNHGQPTHGTPPTTLGQPIHRGSGPTFPPQRPHIVFSTVSGRSRQADRPDGLGRAGGTVGWRTGCGSVKACDATGCLTAVGHVQNGGTMAQEPEQTDTAENIVPLIDVRRRHKSNAQNNPPVSEPRGAPQDDEPPPDAA